MRVPTERLADGRSARAAALFCGPSAAAVPATVSPLPNSRRSAETSAAGTPISLQRAFDAGT